jgi:hypothetical protein
MALRKEEETGNSERSTRMHSLENSLWRGHGPVVIIQDDDDDDDSGGGGDDDNNYDGGVVVMMTYLINYMQLDFPQKVDIYSAAEEVNWSIL